MKKIIIALIAIVFTGSIAAQTIINDPDVEVRSISGSFSAIKVSGGIDLYLSQSDQEAVAVSCNKIKYRDHIKAEVKNNTLRIYIDNPGGIHITFGNVKMKAYVSFKTLQKLEASGASDVKLTGNLDTDNLAIVLSGASDFSGKVTAKDLSVELSGASDAELHGTVTNLSINAQGASSLKGFDLVSENCNAKAQGASDINITVNKELQVSTKGASDVNYKGTAVIKGINASGAGNVNKKG